MVNRVPNEVLFISNEEERAIYVSVRIVEDAPPTFQPYSKKLIPKSNLSDLDIAMQIDSLMTSMVYSDFLDVLGDLTEGGEDLDNVINLYDLLINVLNQNKKGIYAYQQVLELFIPAE